MSSERSFTTTFLSLIDNGILEIGDGYRAKNDELGGDGVIFLRAGHVKDDHIDFSGVERFRSDLESSLLAKSSQAGDTIVTTKGNSTGRTSHVQDWMPQFVYSPHLSYWRSRDSNALDSGFLRYWSRSREFIRQLDGMKISTDMAPYLSLSDQKRLSISIPAVSEQRKIAHVLGTLDDKIELNRKTNETLEAMAKALFKSWFVDFGPVRAKAEGRSTGLPAEISDLFPDSFEDSELGEIPSGWANGVIEDIAEVIDCLHSKKPAQQESGKQLLQLNNIEDSGLLNQSHKYLITADDYAKWSSRIEVEQGDCVITNVGRVGAVAQIPKGTKAAMGRNMTAIRPKGTFPYPTFLLEYLLSPLGREEIRMNIDEGTILNALNVKNIPLPRLPRPPDSVLSCYEESARPLRDSSELRDTLLPRLISGELRIPDAEKLLEEAGV